MFRVCKLPNPAGDEPCLDLLTGVLLQLLVRRPCRLRPRIRHQKLRGRSRLFFGLLKHGSRVQGDAVRVLDIAQILRHNLKKYLVDAVKNRRPAPEILAQLYLPPSLCPGLRHPAVLAVLIALVLLHEQLRAGQAELVDALLHISHHEHVRPPEPLRGQAFQQRLLDIVAVLVFIYQNLRVLPAQLVCHGSECQLSILVDHENPQGLMLQVVKIHDIFFFLALLIPPVKFSRQLQQLKGHAPAAQEVGCRLLHGLLSVQGLHGSKSLLHPFPDRGGVLFFRRVDVFPSGSGDSPEGYLAEAPVQRLVILRRPQPPDHLQLFVEGGDVFFRPPLLAAHLDGALQLLLQLLQLALHISHQIVQPGGVLEAALLHGLQLLPAPGQPFPWEGVALGKCIHLHNIVFDAAVRFARPVGLHKFLKLPVLRLVVLLQHLLHHVCPEKHQFPLIPYAETGVQVQHIEMVSDKA